MLIMLSQCRSLISPQNNIKRKYFELLCWSPNIKASSSPKNHYETLNLSRTCTTKDIREAFIMLSKQYHPDKNKGNPKAQDEFVRVKEAYNILIKPESRREYDFSLKSFSGPSRVYKSTSKDDFYEVHRYDSQYRDPWKDPSFYKNRNFDGEDISDQYYGIKGIKKMTNRELLFWIFVFAGVGIFLQILVIRFANANTKMSRDRQSEENMRHLDYVKARAEFYGTRERQMEEFLRRTGMSDLTQSETAQPNKDISD